MFQKLKFDKNVKCCNSKINAYFQKNAHVSLIENNMIVKISYISWNHFKDY